MAAIGEQEFNTFVTQIGGFQELNHDQHLVYVPAARTAERAASYPVIPGDEYGISPG